MKAIYIVKKGKPENAFELREVPVPVPSSGQVLIKSHASGINFADLVSREGMYRDAPPIPFVPGYEVAGVIEKTGDDVHHFNTGDRVVAFTRFGGYAEQVVTDVRAVVKIPASLDDGTACALATQYCTAYYAAAIAAHLREGENVIVHSAAGGVGTALLQYALHKKCIVIGTTGSDSKIDHLKKRSAQHVINTQEKNFYQQVKNIFPEGVDVIFDALGGNFVKQGIRLLRSGGRIVSYGASQMTGTNLINRIKTAVQFGLYHPAQFMMTSKSLIGVNMLHIADDRPELLQDCLHQVMKLYNDGIFKPQEAKAFSANQIGEAHCYLQERKSTGKVVIEWD